MKKLLSFTLSVVLLLSLCLQLTPANAAVDELKPLPQIGEVISGFKTIEIKDMELINSKTVLFEHEKTGAKLLFIQSKNIDRSFSIAFKTPAVDDTGANHILEHISVSGSEKYPMNDVIFTIINQTYSTYANAFTYPTFTEYPVSSMSEEQLLKLTDVYLDCVYNPLIYTDKNIFLREAWRYEMADADSPLTISGIVYNEMKGALGNISSAAQCNVLDVLFPNSMQSNIYGGDPEKIPDLTYEQIIDTHKTYYHPSNSLMILYGNLDYSKFLKLINDNYLSKFDKKDIEIDYGIVTAPQEKTERTFKFPVTSTSNTVNASQIDYAFALSDVSEEDLTGLSIITSILNQDTSPLKQAFMKKNIGGNLYVSLDSSIPQPVLTFSAQNANENKAKEFKALVDECIADLVKNGYDKELVDATISSVLISNSAVTEQQNLGINLSAQISLMWANYDNLYYLNNIIQNIKNISKKINNNYMENLTARYILNNNHAALVTTIPEAGLAEKQSEQQHQRLADLKASMSVQEIEKIVSDTAAYNEWNSRKRDLEEQKVQKDLQVVKVSDLPVEVKKYEISETKYSDGIRILSAAADVGETGLTALVLDTSAVLADKLHYLMLYSSLLGKLDTKLYTKEQLTTKVMRYLNGASVSLTTLPEKGDRNKFTPLMTASWLGLVSEYEEQLDLVKEIFLNTKFSDTDTILSVVKQQIASMKNQFINNPLNLLLFRNLALANNCINYTNYITGLDYYNFLVQLEQTLQTDPGAVLAELDSLHKLVVNRTNMIAMFSGNKDSIKKYEKAIKAFINELPAKEITAQDYSKLPKPAQREAIILDTSVQYNMISAAYEDMGTEYNGKYIPIGAVINDNYITPKIRFGYGAYSGLVQTNNIAFMIASYRDPNIKETFDVYKGLPEFVRNIEITQEELDRYILKAFSSCTATSGELRGASNALNNYLMGETWEDQLKLLNEIKSTTVQDIKESVAMFENLLKNGACSTIGSADKINANKELYDSIITFEHLEEETLTRAQFIELILNGVPNPVEIAKQQGLLLGDGKGNYYEDSKLTMEQLAVLINRVIVMNGMQLSGEGVSIANEADISPWALESVKALVGAGIMQLDSNGNFNPQEEVTASAVQTLMIDLVNKLSGM